MRAPAKAPKLERIKAYRRGLMAELFAILMLTAKGYRIRKWRYRNHGGEIDIIATRGKTCAFIEVKARPSREEALLAISPHQRLRIQSSAASFLQAHPFLSRYDMRFDVIGWRKFRLPSHYPDAWRL